MILNFPTRFTANGREVGGEVDSKNLSLAGMSRLLLWDTIEHDSQKALRIIVLQRLNAILEKHVDEHYWTEKKDQKDFSQSLHGIILLVQNNLYDVIEGLNGEQSKIQTLAWLIPMDYSLYEAGVSKNSLFWTNLRILVAACFRNEILAWLVHDMTECLQIQSGKLAFSHIIKRFRYELAQYAADGVHPFEKDDMNQKGLMVLWNCVNKYSGQNFIPLRQYFLRSLRNKRVSMLRSIHTDKRKISLKTSNSCDESFNESQANTQVAKRYMDWYYEWLNSDDGSEETFFVAPSSVGAYFPEVWKSIKETQISKTVEELFDSTIKELFLYVESQVPEKHFKALKEFYPTSKMGMVFLMFVFGNTRGTNLDEMQQDFLKIHMKGCIFFDGNKYCFQHLWDLQETFLMMCQEIIQKDPMIQLSFRVRWKKDEDTNEDNEVPF
jgi:hypothetical protein